MVRCCILIASICHLALAQTQMSVSPVDPSIAGVSLLAPNDPAFASFLASQVAANELDALEPILAYSVVVRNNTAKPILGVCVAFKVIDSAGMSLPITQNFENVPPTQKPLIPPGGSLFVSIERGYSYAAVHSRLQSNLTHPVSYYQSATSISASLDSVLFSDGSFAGPDSRQSFALYSAVLDADKEIARSVQQYGSANTAGLVEYLQAQSVGDRSIGGIAAVGVYQWHYKHELAVQARGMKQALAKKGITAVAGIAASLQADASSLALHKQ